MNNSYILGFDVSTSNIGISLFDEKGKLLKVNHISLDSDEKDTEERHFKKIQKIKEYLNENYPKNIIGNIVIEKPLISSKQIDTAAMLNFFGGMFFLMIKEIYDCEVTYVTVDEARKIGAPELYGGKRKSLFGMFDTTLLKKNDVKKMIIMSYVALKFPDIVWLTNQNMMLDKKNFDRADAIMVVLAYLNRNKMLSEDNNNNHETIVEKIEKFLTSYFAYELFCKSLKGNRVEQNSKKLIHFKELKLNEYINIAI
jgi:RNase H-fold protein (predicted Holliday junction resolvase)